MGVDTFDRTDNARLERVYAGGPSYLVNRELTLPCEVVPVKSLVDPAVVDHPALEERIQGMMRIIMPPGALARVSADVRARFKRMASPYECGRVLEDDEPVIIDGVPHVLTVKGCGCTRFVAEERAHSRFFPSDLSGPVKFSEEAQKKADARADEALRGYRFYRTKGSMDFHDADVEFKRSALVRDAGFDAERVLGVYPLSAMPDQDGVLRPMEYFQKEGILVSGWYNHPALLVRALKSNFRLLDLINLLKLGDDRLIRQFVDFVVEQYRLIEADAHATPADYFQWLASRAFDQRVKLFFAGYPNQSAEWQTQARNRSVLCEAIDLEGGDMPGPYRAHLNQDQHFIDLAECFDFLGTTLVLYASAINRVDPDSVDLSELAKMYNEVMSAGFSADVLQGVWDGFLEEQRRGFGSQAIRVSRNFEDFAKAVHRNLFRNSSRSTVEGFEGTGPFCRRLEELVQGRLSS